jgi:pimeloyl-ACP methyl ester carboxylesterase
MTDNTENAVRDRFGSAESAAGFAAAYDAALARWPQPLSSVDISGVFGRTRVQVCGKPDGSPVVLLPGHGSTSAGWFANAGALGMAHRVYAPDLMGDAGLSVPAGVMIRSREDYLAWLEGVLNQLGLETTAICGHSYGAWLALTYAVSAPGRVSRLALIDPTDCFAGLRIGYRLRAVPLFARPTAARARRVIEWESRGVSLDPAATKLSCLGGGEFRGSKVIVARRPSAADLQGLSMPALLVLAEKSKAHNIAKVRATAERLVPQLSVVELPGASHHSLPSADPGRLNQELARFLVDRNNPDPPRAVSTSDSRGRP